MRLVKNAIFGVRNIALRTFTERLKPRWIWFEVTDRCNSRCVHCNIWRKKPTEYPLTLYEIEQTLRDPLFEGLECILNSGGEPVLREDIEEILLIEHKIFPQAKLHLSTNGLLPERALEVIETMIRNNIPIEIGVSLDGIGHKHDLRRGVRGNFAKVDWLLGELTSMRDKWNNKISPLIGLTLSNLTIDSFEEVRSYAEKMRVPFAAQWYNESSFYDNVEKKSVDRTVEKEEMIRLIQFLSRNRLNEKWINWLKGKSIKFQCFAMYTFCVLRCNGDIVPCLSLWDIKAGNVKENTPSQIWHSPEAKKARKFVKSCQGCLNSWGVSWSSCSSFYPDLFFNLRQRIIKSL